MTDRVLCPTRAMTTCDAVMTHPPDPPAVVFARRDLSGTHSAGRATSQRGLGAWALVVLFLALASPAVGVHAASVDGAFDPQHCALCQGLQYCTIMNGQYLFDPVSGYTREATTQLEKQGVCEDLDAKALALSRFGTQLQFKDTPACHALVWNFHCLSWVATTFQREMNGTRVSCSSATSPLPPCRSLCVEVADKCVYSHFYRLYLDEVCGNIGCLSELAEAKTSGSVETNIAETSCVSGKWVYNASKTFSRCSTRAYEPPTASTARAFINILVVILAMASSTWLL